VAFKQQEIQLINFNSTNAVIFAICLFNQWQMGERFWETCSKTVIILHIVTDE